MKKFKLKKVSVFIQTIFLSPDTYLSYAGDYTRGTALGIEMIQQNLMDLDL